MGTTKEINKRVSTMVDVASFLASVSFLVLYVLFLTFSTLTGAPGSCSPVSLATTRCTDDVTASLYFSSSVRIDTFSPTTLSIKSSPIAFMNSLSPVNAPSLADVTTRRRPLLFCPGNHLDTSLSPNAKASLSNSSLRTVAISTRYPVFSSSFFSSSPRDPRVALFRTDASSTMYEEGVPLANRSNSFATADKGVAAMRVAAAAANAF
mmetsp:Transcript_7416/g.14892  ORF Transcript_7416/g.14892 Transcript_7416/m.14892 type:complete len:208 (+) Transcript_7416:245-868(+)